MFLNSFYPEGYTMIVTKEMFEEYYTKLVKFDKFMGLELTVHEPGRITYTIEIKEHHLTAPDQCHGGVISAMMDAVLGVTTLSYAVSRENLCSTVEFKTNYISTTKPGDILEGSAEIDSIGSKLITTSGWIKERKSGRLIAKGLGTFLQYPISKKIDIIEEERKKVE
jgi:uncharacterized protein (TIGR00369 family)